MAGKRKRREQERERGRRDAVRFGPGAGRWDVLLETRDQAELRAHMQRLRAERQIDRSAVRVDTLCGRLERATTYRLSLFVPADGPPGGQ